MNEPYFPETQTIEQGWRYHQLYSFIANLLFCLSRFDFPAFWLKSEDTHQKLPYVWTQERLEQIQNQK